MTPTTRRARTPRGARDVARANAGAKRAKTANDDAATVDGEEKENVRDGAVVGAAPPKPTAMDDLTYDGEIVVASTARELERAMARIEAFDARAGATATTKHCGFDMEWKVSFKRGAGESKTSLVQIAVANEDLSEKLVVLARIHTAGLTRRFKRWVRDGARGKTGFNVRGDARKLVRDHGLEPSRVIELSVLAKERFEGGCPSAPSWSLARLCEHVLGKTLPKDKTRMSNWEREELNENQIKYAAMDAWASLLVYRALMKRDLVESFGGEPYECDPLPDPVESSDEEVEDEDEDEDEDEANAFVGDDEDDEEPTDVVFDDAGDKGELSAQSARVGEIELTDTEREVYEKHMAGASLDDIATTTDTDRIVVFSTLLSAMRKGCAFYFKLLCIPEHLTLFFDDHVMLNGALPKANDFVEYAKIDDERKCKLMLIALTVKLAREREQQQC